MGIKELCGRGWLVVDPPEPEDGNSVVARHGGEPIKAGLLTERVVDEEDELQFRYRTGRYNLDVKIDFLVGRGQIKVEEADGYI